MEKTLQRIIPWCAVAMICLLLMAGTVFAQTATTTTGSTTTDPQTTCTSTGGKWCKYSDGVNGYCQTSGTCPAYTAADCAAQSGTWCKNSDGTSGWCSSIAGYKCPAYTEADCTAQAGKWCKSSTPNTSMLSTTGWCSTDVNYTCPAYNEVDCKAQNKTWCVSPGTATTSGWCTDSCPYTVVEDPKTKCTTQGYKWCLNSDGKTGWCTNSSTGTCPAYNETDCAAQSGKWCKYSQSSTTVGATGWCSSDKTYICPAYTEADCTAQNKTWCVSPGSATTSGYCTDSCPYDPNAPTKCTTGGGKWCKSSDSTGSGWCQYQGTCPAYNATDCIAQSGEWCPYTSGTGGWCATGGSTCPINDKATCIAKSRKWCVSSGSSTGWCTSRPEDVCPVSTEADCKAQAGEWCVSSYGGSGWCAAANSCPVNDAASCTAKGRSWCKYQTSAGSAMMSGSGGWCANPTDKCPAYTEADCKAQSGNWCVSSTSGYTWCQTSTCPEGTIPKPISPPVVPPVPPPPPPPQPPTSTPPRPMWFDFPKTSYECEKYYGNWCVSSWVGSSGGYCKMGSSSCMPQTKTGYMVCWDKTQVLLPQTCPLQPMSETACSSAGKYWCKNYANSGSGATAYTPSAWCDSEPCVIEPPVGKAWCPDGKSAANALSECPKKTVPDNEQYMTCPDGTMVRKGATCPEKPNDEVSICVKNAGTWCTAQVKGHSGYCAYSGGCRKDVEPTPTQLTDRELRLLTGEKKSVARDLNSLEVVFKKFDDAVSLAKVQVLRGKLESVSNDSSAFDTLQKMRDEISVLQQVRDELNEKKKIGGDKERDESFQKRALQNMKRAAGQFKKQLGKIGKIIKDIEKSGIELPVSAKEPFLQVESLIDKILDVKTFDEAEAAGEELRDAVIALNEVMPELMQLSRLPKISKLLNQEFKKAEKALVRVTKLATRFKADVLPMIDEARRMLDEAEYALANLKSGAGIDREPFEYLETEVYGKLGDAMDLIGNIEALANLKKEATRIRSEFAKFDAQIKRLAKKKVDVEEAKELLAEMREKHKELMELVSQKLNEDTIPLAISILGELGDGVQKLAEMLKLGVLVPLEKELRTPLQLPKDLEPLDLSSFEVSFEKSVRLANYLRTSITRSYFAYGF